jgi:hypothetical protein
MNTSNSGKRHSIPNVFKPTDESSERAIKQVIIEENSVKVMNS